MSPNCETPLNVWGPSWARSESRLTLMLFAALRASRLAPTLLCLRGWCERIGVHSLRPVGAGVLPATVPMLCSPSSTRCFALSGESALEGVGLDPQVGYLHALRPGRPALALDLMEELRPAVVDRLALRMINRRQIRVEHFDEMPGGAVSLNEAGRRATLVAYQKYKERVTPHRLLKDRVPVGLIPHIQARLLARHLRGDLKHYLPYIMR